MDQVPLPFALDKTTTYESKEIGHDDKVWVATPGSGLDKRQCTLQMCFSPEDNNCRIDIIFRGSGKRIADEEKQLYHKDVDVYWQKNAWADLDFSLEWIKRTLKPAVENCGLEFLLICDNLGCQVKEEFQQEIRKLNGIVHYGVSGATDIWQPVDAGAGHLLKQKVRQKQDEWLMDEENMNIWMGNSEDKLTVSKRRILITHWVGDAYNILQGDNYAGFLRNCFEKTGCLLTADGSEDEKVKPEGLNDYKVMPPLKQPGPDRMPNIEIPEVTEDITENLIEDQFEHEDDSEPLEEDIDLEAEEADIENDRVYDADLVGKRICGMYEASGWHTGTIQYFNVKLQKYLLLFEDNSTDLIKKEEIDGVELYFEDNPPKRSRRVDYKALANGK